MMVNATPKYVGEIQYMYVNNKHCALSFHSCTVHLDNIKVFCQLMHNRVALKEY